MSTSTSRTIFIVGAGGHGRVCSEIAESAGFDIAGFIDIPRRPGERINDKQLTYRTLDEFASQDGARDAWVFIAISSNLERLIAIQSAKTLGLHVATLVHPSAVLSRTCSVGYGTVIMPGSIVNANTAIGIGCILNTASTIDHDCRVEDGAQIAPGVHAASNVLFGLRCFVGTGASIKQCIEIGRDAIVGCGAAVIRNVAGGTTVAGNPARIIKKTIP